MLVASVISDFGAFMLSTGVAWLMISFNGEPMYVALTQTAFVLPFVLFGLPAGAIGDTADLIFALSAGDAFEWPSGARLCQSLLGKTTFPPPQLSMASSSISRGR